MLVSNVNGILPTIKQILSIMMPWTTSSASLCQSEGVLQAESVRVQSLPQIRRFESRELYKNHLFEA